MFEPQGTKIMIDLHGLSVKEVKKLLEEKFATFKERNIGEFYLITGRGNHINSNGSRGILKKILPKLLKPYCHNILQMNSEDGAFKIILKPQQNLSGLKDLLSSLFVNKDEQIILINILKLLAEKNDIDAILTLANIYLCQFIEGFDDINEGLALLQRAKEIGSLEAYVQLGILYHEGSSIKQNHKKAFQLFRYAANKEDPVAQYYLAICYVHGKGVKYNAKNDEQAVLWMKKSADQNSIAAQASVSDFYLMGKITQQNIELGIFYKTKAAEQGYVEAQIDLARIYASGYGVTQNYNMAFDWYLSASQFNHPYAVYQVGFYLFEGRCGDPDPEKAFPYFLRAAELGDADGQGQVGLMMTEKKYSKYSGIPYDLETGIQWLRKAKAQNHIGASQILEEIETRSTLPKDENGKIDHDRLDDNQFKALWIKSIKKSFHLQLNEIILLDHDYKFLLIDSMLLEGEKLDKQKALSAIEFMSERNCIFSLRRLARFHTSGFNQLNIDKNLEKAIQTLEKAVALGDSKSMVSLGYFYENGLGVQKSLKIALTLYLNAVEHHNPEACCRTANLCVQGLLGEPDPQEIYGYFKLALHYEKQEDLIEFLSSGLLDNYKKLGNSLDLLLEKLNHEMENLHDESISELKEIFHSSKQTFFQNKLEGAKYDIEDKNKKAAKDYALETSNEAIKDLFETKETVDGTAAGSENNTGWEQYGFFAAATNFVVASKEYIPEILTCNMQ